VAEPDITMPSNATPGEWKAVLAPMLTSAASAEDVNVYVVITQNMSGEVELRTNVPDPALCRLLRLVTPGGSRD
jgi:hypothetical protein